MKQIFAWLFAAIFFAAGCAQSPDLAEPVRGGGYENADGLVIVAACPPATRTDIEEGKSTWEAGDRITVVYDGAAYEYTAAEAGPTTAFTSEAGIADYDASKALTAYYPATTAEGVVAVEAERTIALDAESQSNPARAPLVGLPTSGNLAEGALEVTFRNIFSVIELRIDAGELASAAQSLTVEPADEAAFEGFLSFEGTVDPETLALTPAENGTGNSLIFNFAEGVDLTKPQTIKFPVGRFRSEAGLRLTLGTADGKSYSKNIYKTGITSYAEQGGVFRAKHMAKALYAFAPQGGISTADDLIEFAAAVNAGETLAPWQDDKGVVVLLDDIDLAEVTDADRRGYVQAGEQCAFDHFGKTFYGLFRRTGPYDPQPEDGLQGRAGDLGMGILRGRGQRGRGGEPDFRCELLARRQGDGGHRLRCGGRSGLRSNRAQRSQ